MATSPGHSLSFGYLGVFFLWAAARKHVGLWSWRLAGSPRVPVCCHEAREALLRAHPGGPRATGRRPPATKHAPEGTSPIGFSKEQAAGAGQGGLQILLRAAAVGGSLGSFLIPQHLPGPGGRPGSCRPALLWMGRGTMCAWVSVCMRARTCVQMGALGPSPHSSAGGWIFVGCTDGALFLLGKGLSQAPGAQKVSKPTAVRDSTSSRSTLLLGTAWCPSPALTVLHVGGTTGRRWAENTAPGVQWQRASPGLGWNAQALRTAAREDPVPLQPHGDSNGGPSTSAANTEAALSWGALCLSPATPLS